MTWQTWLISVGIVLLGGVQYGLMAYAIRDLLRRPRVRGDNKVLWGLVVLCLPIAGAMIYFVMGPTSFLPRPERPSPRPSARPRSAAKQLDG